jgi:hypothetical protein
MKKLSFQYFLTVLILINIWIFPSCQQQQAPAKQIISQSEMDTFHFRAVHSFPNYDNISKIIYLLKDIDVIFIQDAVNSIENLEKYTDNDLLMAANIGVYMTDIGYMWSYNETDAAFNHNIAVLSLADQLDMAKAFLDSFFERYSKEDADPDTILLLIERDLSEAVKQFPEEKRLELYSAMLTGSFVEKLHLLYEMIKRCPEISNPVDISVENLQKLVWIAIGQIKALEELNKQIDSYAIPKEYLLYHEELVKLDSVMKKTNFLQDSSIVRSVQLIEDPEFLNLYQEVSRIRNFVTNPVIKTIR